MSWDTKKVEFQAQFDNLNTTSNVDQLVTQLNATVNTYLDKKSTTDYTNIQTISKQLQTIKTNYSDLNDKIVKALATDITSTDLPGSLTQNGTLQTQIKKLETRHKELQVEVDTALARDELLRSRDTNVTSHQLFLLDRPVRKGMIPYLWALSIIFIGVGLVLYKMMLPPIGLDYSTVAGMEMNLTDLLLNKTVLISMLVCFIIIIVTVGLKAGGVIGK
jgi:chaperonin cofactor prefoldin